MGRGQGARAGGCRCGSCSASCAFRTITIVVSVVGAVLTLGGIGVLIGCSKVRLNAIKRVDSAVAAWEDPTAATGWRQFQQLNASVVLTPPPYLSGNPTCFAYGKTIVLSPANCPYDNYYDETNRFRSVKQLSFCAIGNYSALQGCDMQVSFQVQQPGSGGPTNLVTFSNAVAPAGGVSIKIGSIGSQLGCSASRSKCRSGPGKRCARKCEANFAGSFSCGSWTCNTYSAWVSSVAIKLRYDPGSSSPFAIDTANPAMGPASGGANVLPSGYTWDKYDASRLKGPLWSHQGLSYSKVDTASAAVWPYGGAAYVNSPGNVLFRVRSSSDPFLAYMAATKGNGSFFTLSWNAIRGIGAALVSVGGALMLLALAGCGCAAWGRRLALRSPEQPPRGCLGATAWRCGKRLLAPPTAPPQQPDGIPLAAVAQPVPNADAPPPPPPGGYYYPLQGAPMPPAGMPPPAGMAHAVPPPQPPPPGPGYYAYAPAPAPVPGGDVVYGTPYYPPAPMTGVPQQAAATYPGGQFDQPPPKN